jgi:putative redox protein
MTDAVSAHISETGTSAFAVQIETGGHRFIGDEPGELGGSDLGPSPYQLLAAALGECTTMTVRWFARQQKWPVEHIAVDVTHRKAELEGEPGKVDLFHKTLTISGDALTPEQRLRLIEIAARCPVHRTLEARAHIETRVG